MVIKQDLKPHTLSSDNILDGLSSSHHGLSLAEAKHRLQQYGLNTLPKLKQAGLVQVFFRQFSSPLIYVLFAAASLSLFIREWSDAGFIFAVLLINAIIGTTQEFSAQQAAAALQDLVKTRSRILRAGESYEIDSEELVPGDIVLLESGDRVPADMRLLKSNNLQIDESLLTGESLAVTKQADVILNDDTILAERKNMVFAGSLVVLGRAHAVVVNTALSTELGNIATSVLGKSSSKAPLLVRMEKFTHRIAMIVGIAAIIMSVVALMRGMPIDEVFLLAVALAVSAIPEGLPVALTVALAVGMRRMAKRHVIVQKLVAVEALGSCTYIATDKTGTLTVNQLTVQRIVLPNNDVWNVSGEGIVPEGKILKGNNPLSIEENILLKRICHAAVLPNEAFLGLRDNSWTVHGDPMDIALLVLAHKSGLVKDDIKEFFSETAMIPFESEHQFAASLNKMDASSYVSVKGAYEKLLPMCSHMANSTNDEVIDLELINRQAEELAAQGYRVLALASGEVKKENVFLENSLNNLTFLALVGVIDPLRSEAKAAVIACKQAGIEVAMVTGDHPVTAFAIARELGLADDQKQVVTGSELKHANKNTNEFDALVSSARVFARVEPTQKLNIINSLQRIGHFVAATGDGANDAPALKAAEVGVAMGKYGTDIARESSELIITDDNFSSIVAGIEEGRVAYNNVRKVIFLLISTGAAEIVLFTLALFSGLPLPLLAVQLLWLNLVTNGIQDVALAFEPAEGDELKSPPRSPKEGIFNKIMIERVLLSSLVIGVVAFFVFQYLYEQGHGLDAARNGTLLLMVLFENIHVFNSRSETRSVFTHNPLRNHFLLFGTMAAQLIHIGAMYTPWISDVLRIQPVSLDYWLDMLLISITVLIVMEGHKLLRRYY
ncbi:MAG: HAD-IC family P-type ATPase [Woeseiaceae bacterium]